MKLSISTDIFATPTAVWKIISDIENCANVISGIDKIEILEPATGPSIVGLKWRETRTMYGKSATETMWITDAKNASHYETRAESHGAIYQSKLSLEKIAAGTSLTMSFEGQPQTIGSKILWALTGWMAKGYMVKALNKDLADIKAAAEE